MTNQSVREILTSMSDVLDGTVLSARVARVGGHDELWLNWLYKRRGGK